MREEEEERRTRQQKQVPFHNRTHRTFLSFACVETPPSDAWRASNQEFCLMFLLHLLPSSLVLRSQNCPSSRFAVTSIKRQEPIL